MPSFKITCPFCSKQFKLTTENPQSLAGKEFRCKGCNHIISLSQVLHLEEKSVLPPTVGDSTHIVGVASKGKVILEILSTGDRIALGEGQYTLGRRSSDSQATVQIAPDPYMSRLHARLAAKALGGRFIVQVCSVKSGNPVFLNGKVCNAGQPYTLSSGDRMQLGGTQVTVTIE